MCLAVLARVAHHSGEDAVVEIGGVRRAASLALQPDARPGDWVLVHAGYAIALLDEEEALRALADAQGFSGGWEEGADPELAPIHANDAS
ncbi:MAG: HypC/HybG/HupF family hydrogenase formation chaperone [Candidatus Hydrogenedentota bacterium]